MAPFEFKCRATNAGHSCRYADEEEPYHLPKLSKCVTNIVGAMQGMLFQGVIKSPVNSYQIDISTFDSEWIKKAARVGWKLRSLPNLRELSGIPNIKPDALLTQGNVNTAVEIEKSNEKTIWFDFIKLLMLIEQGIANFGMDSDKFRNSLLSCLNSSCVIPGGIVLSTQFRERNISEFSARVRERLTKQIRIVSIQILFISSFFS